MTKSLTSQPLQSLVETIACTGSLTYQQERQIECLLVTHQFDESDLSALDRLIELLFAGEVVSESDYRQARRQWRVA
ncbi:MAG: hypothetical protein NW237_17730 [Cyanobacteriota bacterium]|nr:hypothetical protein [Cyanobacteriota bacterium]